MKIGIVGNGFVGKATSLFQCDEIEVLVYDIIPTACSPIGTTMDDINNCDLIFICVPTPLNYDGSCKTDIIDSVLSKITNPYTIIRSTIPIGFSKSKNCYFMPEFLTELNWKNDFISNKCWVVGLLDVNPPQDVEFIDRISTLITTSFLNKSIEHNSVLFCTTEEAELAKLVKNSFLANKVSFFNEIYDLAKSFGIDYENVTDIVSLDERIGSSHMKVPGHDGKKGFGGCCLVKDSMNVFNLMTNKNLNSLVLENVLYRNEYFDRRERDWLALEGRTLMHTYNEIILVIGKVPTTLCRQDRIIITNDIVRNKTNNIIIKNINTTKKMFFPRLDTIYYTVNKDLSLKDRILSTINILELVKLHDCSFLYDTDGDFVCEALIQEEN